MTSRNKDYHDICLSLLGLIQDETDALANISNSTALLYHSMGEINWAGFYFYKENQLILGPFQGKPACIRIILGRGVCGSAAMNRETVLVQDVHEFPGHIACDAASASEIVIPIIKNDKLIGVLDIDSPVKSRFDEEDRIGLEKFVEILNDYIQWENVLN